MMKGPVEKDACGRGEHSILNNSHTKYLSKHVFNEVLYHVGPVDYCSAVSPATQDLSLEHLGVITGITNSDQLYVMCLPPMWSM